MMTSTAADFWRELEVFGTEVDGATQFFYADLALHSVPVGRRQVYEFLNATPLFWNTCSAALQTAAFVTLGRIFDQGSAHNLDKLLRIAQENPGIFSKGELGRRKQGGDATAPQWLPEYLLDVYEPTPTDFRRLRGHARKHRKIYESSYRDLRSKVFAHKEISDKGEINALFRKGNVRELQRLFAFLGSLHATLWQLFFNSRKPVLRPLRYSVKRIPRTRPKTLQERITFDVKQLLMSASRASERRIP